VGVAAPPEARGPSGPAFAQPAETVIAQEGTGRDAARVIGQLLSPMVRAKTSASFRVHRYHRLRGHPPRRPQRCANPNARSPQDPPARPDV